MTLLPKLRFNPIAFAFLLVFACGSVLRFFPGLLTGFPINDGGMLLAMIRDLRLNGLILPAFTSYNFSSIPYAYPPLGMYLAAILSNLFSIAEIELLRWLPALFCTLTIPAFYWLAQEITVSPIKAFLAASFYAILPGSYEWLIMGGGLTRSLGILCSIIAIRQAYRLFRGDERSGALGAAVVWGALSVLSHPEMGLQTAVIFFVFWLYLGRGVSGVKKAVKLLFGSVLLTAFWWLSVIYHHGLDPFISAVQTGVHETLLASLFHAFFSIQGDLPIMPILRIVGLFLVIRRREFLLPLWSLAPFLADPRNAPAVAIFPFLLLASEGLYALGTRFRDAYSITFPRDQNASRNLKIAGWCSLGTVFLYLFYTSFLSIQDLRAISLSPSDRETMQWIGNQTPPGSRFLLVTNRGEISPMVDSYQEWFPVVAERHSVSTLQGREWTLGSHFYLYSQSLMALQACPQVDCVHTWLRENETQIDFILIQKQGTSEELLSSLTESQSYEVLYDSADVEIFAPSP